MKTTNVFSRNLQAYLDGHSLIANKGGQGSSKTISILQLLYQIAQRRSRKITVASYALPHLKAGAMDDFDKIIVNDGKDPREFKNIADSTYYFGKSKIEFVGIRGNEARATGPRRDILYINEANKNIAWKVFDLMFARTHECTIIDWNPSMEYWYDDHIKDKAKHKLIHSTYLDNIYLPDNERNLLESRKNDPKFAKWWKVYGLGELGQLEGAILENVSFGEFPTYLPIKYGLDFGFSPDPDAMIAVAIDKKEKKIYCKEIVYKTMNGTLELIRTIGNSVKRTNLIVADSASPRTIKDIRTHGYNIKAVSKTKTVSDWLREMQNYEIVITEDSYNLEKELNSYVWDDKKAGIPIDANNHLIDAMRYVFMDNFAGVKPYIF